MSSFLRGFYRAYDTGFSLKSAFFNEQKLNQFYRYAYVLCLNEHDAYDLLQGALEQYLQPKKEDIKNASAYMHTLIRNRFIDHCRYQMRWQQEVYEEESHYDISPIDLEHWLVNQRHIAKVWATLSVWDRDALYHWVVLGYSTDEVCAKLDIPRGTFLSRMHRLRKTLNAQQTDIAEVLRGE